MSLDASDHHRPIRYSKSPTAKATPPDFKICHITKNARCIDWTAR